MFVAFSTATPAYRGPGDKCELCLDVLWSSFADLDPAIAFAAARRAPVYVVAAEFHILAARCDEGSGQVAPGADSAKSARAGQHVGRASLLEQNLRKRSLSCIGIGAEHKNVLAFPGKRDG
jgi:hypothetical protein